MSFYEFLTLMGWHLLNPVVSIQRSESMANRYSVKGFFVTNRVGLELAHQKDGPRCDS